MLRQSDSASLMRFMREQGTRIAHDHVVTPLSWAGEDDRVLFTMPLVRGGSVATLVGDHGALPARWVRELLGQLLTALDAVHGTGVVHRDVKPANLLLHATGTARPHLMLTEGATTAELLRTVASGQDLVRAAELLAADHPALAELIRVHGLGTAEDVRAHLEGGRGGPLSVGRARRTNYTIVLHSSAWRP